jgi:hypothetical protein
MANRPDTWYWKCGATQLSVPAMGFTSLDQRPPGLEDQPPNVGTTDLYYLGPAVGELSYLVGSTEAAGLGLLSHSRF